MTCNKYVYDERGLGFIYFRFVCFGCHKFSCCSIKLYCHNYRVDLCRDPVHFIKGLMQLYHFSRKEQQINQECDELSAFITDLDPLLSSRTHWREPKKKGRIGGLGEGDTSLNKFQKMTVLCFWLLYTTIVENFTV